MNTQSYNLDIRKGKRKFWWGSDSGKHFAINGNVTTKVLQGMIFILTTQLKKVG